MSTNEVLRVHANQSRGQLCEHVFAVKNARRARPVNKGAYERSHIADWIAETFGPPVR